MTTLIVEGMTCGGCVRSVETALKKMDPEAPVAIDLDSGRVEFGGKIDPAAAREAIEAAGFDVVG